MNRKVLFVVYGLCAGCSQEQSVQTFSDSMSCEAQREFALVQASSEINSAGPEAVKAGGVACAVSLLFVPVDMGATAAAACTVTTAVLAADAQQQAQMRRDEIIRKHLNRRSTACMQQDPVFS